MPLLAGGTALIFAACLGAMGIKRFYDQPVSWRDAALITGLTFAGLTFFIVGHDSVADADLDLFGRPIACRSR